MSLYVGGAVTVHAKLKSRSDWEIFDQQQNVLTNIASKHNVFISRNSVNDGDDIAFVISNREIDYTGISAGDFIEGEFQIAPDEAFTTRAEAFIHDINQNQEVLEQFKRLEWNSAAVRHYVIS